MKIVGVEAIPLRARMAETFSFASVDRRRSLNVLVRLHGEDGTTGIGEVCPVPHLSGETQESICQVVNDKLGPALLNEDATSIRPLLSKLRRVAVGADFTISGLDVALHDLVGKALGVPVAALLGGVVRDRVPIHASCGWFQDKNEMADEAQRQAQGYSFLKTYIGRDEPGRDLDRIAAVRSKIDDSVKLLVDINGLWSPSTALRYAPALADLDVVALEQPISRADVSGQERFFARTDIDVILDEGVKSCWDVVQACATPTGSVINVGYSKMGGMRPAFEAALIADAAHLGTAIGSLAEMGVGTAAGLHLSAAAPHLTYPSYLSGHKRYEMDVLTASSLVVEGGEMLLPQSPGLGITVDEDRLRALAAHQGAQVGDVPVLSGVP